ncbi:MAG: BPSS1780 family membrane protein [Lacisediminimonas sp.]|nr:BPSS1780 family membrane protein [Lacisediminimonas sp.]
MEKIPARAGWLWIKEGFALFRRQPAEMSTLFLSYMMLMLLIGVVPLLGQILPLVLIPVFSIAFMQGCANVESGIRVHPRLLATGFRSPALRRLLMLGLLYLVMAALAVAASSLVDGGDFLSVMAGRTAADSKAIQDSDMMSGMLVAALLYTPPAMAFWYAAPLVAWHDMGVGKAVFYSFFAVLRAGRAFMVYGLAWILVGVVLPVLVSSLLALLIGQPLVTVVVLLPLSILLTVVMYCSFYPTYTHVFGREFIPTPAVST